MSWSIATAGTPTEVVDRFKARVDEIRTASYGEQTLKVLDAQVVALAAQVEFLQPIERERLVIVESAGHGDSGVVQSTFSVRTIFV